MKNSFQDYRNRLAHKHCLSFTNRWTIEAYKSDRENCLAIFAYIKWSRISLTRDIISNATRLYEYNNIHWFYLKSNSLWHKHSIANNHAKRRIYEKSRIHKKIIQIEIFNAIDFVNARFKIIFDFKHKSLAFNTSDKVYFRLHREYSLSEKKNLKLFNQRSDSYIILRKINNLTYELNLSSTSRVHSIIFKTQLESALDSDLFDRSRSINSDSVKMNENTSTKNFFEVKKILRKKNRKYDKITITQYLVKWKDEISSIISEYHRKIAKILQI